MSVLDFKEIPSANAGDGKQDTFEFLTRDCLNYLGHKVLEGPDRGADGGRDVIVDERRVGVGGETVLRWLVSCKHNAHSGKSVTTDDEHDIRDRIEKYNCQGFIAFYSTLPSAGLGSKLKPEALKAEVQVFDCQKIEGKLLGLSKGIELAARYFPKSIDALKTENPRPAAIFTEDPALRCAYFGKDLLVPESHGIIVVWTRLRTDYKTEKEHFEDIYWCCKGFCDQKLADARGLEGLLDGWEDIPDVMMPIIFVKWVMSIVNVLRSGVTYSDEAFSQLKEFMLQVFPFIARHLTAKEKEKVQSLAMIPEFLGGLGY